MVGRVDLLDMQRAVDHWKAQGLDLSAILYRPEVEASVPIRKVPTRTTGCEHALDQELLKLCGETMDKGTPVKLDLPIRNTNRTVGTILGSELTRKYGFDGLPDDTIDISFSGSAGQSFGAFVPRGITLRLRGRLERLHRRGASAEASSSFTHRRSHLSYRKRTSSSATSRSTALRAERRSSRGVAGERFCVRNSGAVAVVEGTGDHGCEYMTGGRAIVIGKTGRNFGAGMSGGIAYVWNPRGEFEALCNLEMVDLEALDDSEEIDLVRGLLERHVEYTGSTVAAGLLARWPGAAREFTKVMPTDYRRVLLEQERERELSTSAAGGAGG